MDIDASPTTPDEIAKESYKYLNFKVLDFSYKTKIRFNNKIQIHHSLQYTTAEVYYSSSIHERKCVTCFIRIPAVT